MFTEFTIFLFAVLEPLHQASTQKQQHQFLHQTSNKHHTDKSSVTYTDANKSHDTPDSIFFQSWEISSNSKNRHPLKITPVTPCLLLSIAYHQA